MKALLAHLHAPIYEERLRVLCELILPHLRDGDRVLDVGCGGGALGARLRSEAATRGLKVEVNGLERSPRGGEPINVTSYDGGRFPFSDQAFDVVIVADVLHHEAQPDALLRECVRVSSRNLVIKDHQLSGPLAKMRVSLIDWAANAGYGVPCLYRYNDHREWRLALQHLGPLVEERTSLNVYPIGINAVLGRRLHYFAVIGRPSHVAKTTN